MTNEQKAKYFDELIEIMQIYNNSVNDELRYLGRDELPTLIDFIESTDHSFEKAEILEHWFIESGVAKEL